MQQPQYWSKASWRTPEPPSAVCPLPGSSHCAELSYDGHLALGEGEEGLQNVCRGNGQTSLRLKLKIESEAT